MCLDKYTVVEKSKSCTFAQLSARVDQLTISTFYLRLRGELKPEVKRKKDMAWERFMDF